MLLQDLNSKIGAEFPKYIYSSRIINGNELYLEVDPDHIMKLSMHLNCELGCALVSLFASDERALSGNYNEAEISPASLKRTDVRKFSTAENFLRMRYKIYYSFAERESGNLIILTTAVD
ncbi:MAG TPA: hypothetical protein VM577_08325, partial [Anaerovoracaceae bacterium]|nr:hypothetical protein [Anaerovoracaceae bacterium]